MMKHLTKRLLILLLVVSLSFSLVGCFADKLFGNTTDTSSDNKNDQSEKKEPKPYTVAYVTDYSNIKNIIFIIGDGMGEEQLNAGELFAGKDFAFRDSFNLLYSDTNSLNSSTDEPTETTDSAAGATALATGHLTYNKKIAMGKTLSDVYDTFLDLAKSVGKSTAVVTTDYLSGATPACFTAHASNRSMTYDIIRSQAKSGVDLLIGQYEKTYDECESDIVENYNYCKTFDRDAILSKKNEDTLCLFNMEKETSDSVELKEATELAIDYLKDDTDGFVLVIEQAHIDKKASDGDFEGMAKTSNSLNDTVEAALNFAKDRNDTAIIVTADHETGGLKTSSDPDEYSNKCTNADGDTFSYEFATTNHTQTNVPIYFTGFGLKPELMATYSSSEKMKNCEIFLMVKDLVLHGAMVTE